LSENIKVSIITVVYNGEKYLEQTIQSILNQTYKNIEYIIIDGGSTDRTIEIIKRYEYKLAYWISEKDNGIYDAMNKGIKKSTGELVGIINADDWYEKGAANNIVECYFNNEKPDIIYGNLKLLNEETNQARISIPLIDRLNKDMSLNHPTCFVKKDIYNDKLFDTSYRICADYNIMMHFKVSNKRFYYLDKLISNMRIGGASDNFILSTNEVYRVQKKYFGISIAVKNIISRYMKRAIKNIILLLFSKSKVEKIKGFKL